MTIKTDESNWADEKVKLTARLDPLAPQPTQPNDTEDDISIGDIVTSLDPWGATDCYLVVGSRCDDSVLLIDLDAMIFDGLSFPNLDEFYAYIKTDVHHTWRKLKRFGDEQG